VDDEKIRLHIDIKGYKDKKAVKKDFGTIKVRLQGKSPPVEAKIEEIAEKIQEGKTISPAVMKGTEAKDFEEQQLFMVDIDNKNTYIPILQVEDAISICEKNGLQVAFYYYTFSHTEKIPKFRLAFVMNEVIKDAILRDTIMRKLIELFEQADTSCKHACSIFLGTNKEVVICDLKARITVDNLLKIPPKSVIVKKKKTSRADKELEELINKFDFFSYLKKRNGELEHETSRYAMFKTCEICGHHNDLVYYYETNSFYCFDEKRSKRWYNY
jgi:hypothetical protein